MYMPSPGLTEFDYVKPASLAEASRLASWPSTLARRVRLWVALTSSCACAMGSSIPAS